MAAMKAALTQTPNAAPQGAIRLITAVILPWTTALRACEFPGSRRNSERLTPH
jgi:hypothetical protein